MAPKQRCPVCSSRRWHRDRSSGSYVCEEGHLLQGYVQESTESQEVSRHFSFKRDIKGKKRKRKIKSASNDHFHGDRATFLLYQSMQWILRENLRVMIEELGYPEELEFICKDLWTMFVASCKVGYTPGDFEKGEERSGSYSGPREGDRYKFSKRKRKKKKKEEGEEEQNDSEDDEDETLESESEKEQRASGEDSDDSIDIEFGEDEVKEKAKRDKEKETDVVTENEAAVLPEANPYAFTRPKKNAKVIKKLSVDPRDGPKLVFLLVILYLGCITLRLPIFLSDILRLAENYQILHLDAKKSLPPEIQEHLGLESIILSPVSITSIGSATHGPQLWLSRMVQMYYVDYDVLFPEPNLPLLNWRLCRSLALSPLIYSYSKSLLSLLPTIPYIATASKIIPTSAFSSHQPELTSQKWSKKRIDLPEAILVAVICIVVRELHRGSVESDIDLLELPRAEVWIKAMEEITKIGKEGSPSLLWSKEVVSMSDVDIDSYLDFCESNLISKTTLPPHMKEIDKHFPAPRRPNNSPHVVTDSNSERINSIISNLYSKSSTSSETNSTSFYPQLIEYASELIAHTSEDLISLISVLDNFLLKLESQLKKTDLSTSLRIMENEARKKRNEKWKDELLRRKKLGKVRRGVGLKDDDEKRGGDRRKNKVNQVQKEDELAGEEEDVDDIEMEDEED